MAKCSLKNISECQKKEESPLNLLWNLLLNKEDAVQNIFNNVKVSSRDKICDYLNEPHEDSKGENILQYIVEQRPKEILDFLNSELVKQVANVENCIFQQFTFLNDNKESVFNIALTNNTSFANLLKSNVFQLSLPEGKKYNIFVDETKRVTILDDVINLAHTNNHLLGTFFNDSSIFGMSIDHKNKIFSRLKYTSDFIGMKEQYDLNMIKKIAETDFYQTLDCENKKSFLEYGVQDGFCAMYQEECEAILGTCLSESHKDL